MGACGPSKMGKGRVDSDRDDDGGGGAAAAPATPVPPPVPKLTLSSGHESVQGPRPTMEDTFVALDRLDGVDWDCGCYCVYDGHAGVDAARLCEEYFHDDLRREPTFTATDDLMTAVRGAIPKTDAKILERGVADGWKNGATAVITLVRPATLDLYSANLGDSEAVLARRAEPTAAAPAGEAGAATDTPPPPTPPPPSTPPKLEPVVLSFKHRANVADEKKRITSAGGTVIFGRVFGDLAVSRSFGDGDYKRPKAEGDFISIEPHTAHHTLLPRRDEFLVSACDGLWDVMKYTDVIELVARERDDGKDAGAIAKLLAETALKRNSQDNITIVVTFFTWSD